MDMAEWGPGARARSPKYPEGVNPQHKTSRLPARLPGLPAVRFALSAGAGSRLHQGLEAVGLSAIESPNPAPPEALTMATTGPEGLQHCTLGTASIIGFLPTEQ